MKYFVASDLHGSAVYCEKMLKCFEDEKADKLILLGDILYHGPRNDLPLGYAPKKVIEMLNNVKDKITCVRGNCDAEVDQMVLEFDLMETYKCMKSNGRTIYITHGHVINMNKQSDILKHGDILLHGHTHVPVWIPFGDDNIYLNPGSLSIPKEGSWHGYMTIEDGKYIWKDLDGNTKHEMKI